MGRFYKPLPIIQKEVSDLEEKRKVLIEEKGVSCSDVKDINIKISKARLHLDKSVRLQKRIAAIDEKIYNFLGVRPSTSSLQPRAKEAALSRYILYTYAMDKGIPGSHIARYCQLEDCSTPSRSRRIFMKRMVDNKEWGSVYEGFKTFATIQI